MEDDALWAFVDASGSWMSSSFGFPRMAGRVLGWLLVCSPAEQAAAQLAEALGASAGAISGATGMLVRAKLVDRLHVRGDRADRFRLRPESWDEQLGDQAQLREARALLAQGLAALADEPPARRARLEDLDDFYAWYQARIPQLHEEWQAYKRSRQRGQHG